MSKIKNYEEIGKIAYRLRFFGEKIVTTNGGFDILHCAHLNLFEKAKKEGNKLIVLLNSDDSIKRFKGDSRPIVNQNERAYMLSGFSCVDYVSIFNEDKPLRLLEIIKPHIHVKGGSYIEERIKEERETLEKWDGKLKLFELEEGHSTTDIINKILERYKN